MGEQPHVSLLERLVRAVEQGDVATIAGLFAENAVWHLPSDTPTAETCEGREMILGLLGKLLEATGGDFRVVLYEAVPDGEGTTWWCRLPSGEGDADAPTGLAVRIDQQRIVEVWQGEGWPAFGELPVPRSVSQGM